MRFHEKSLYNNDKWVRDFIRKRRQDVCVTEISFQLQYQVTGTKPVSPGMVQRLSLQEIALPRGLER